MPDKDNKNEQGADPSIAALMPAYLARRRVDLGNLRAALETQDFDQIRRTGHNLHGSGGAYGLDEISRIGAALESAAASRDADAASQALDAMAAFLNKTTAG